MRRRRRSQRRCFSGTFFPREFLHASFSERRDLCAGLFFVGPLVLTDAGGTESNVLEACNIQSQLHRNNSTSSFHPQKV